MGDNARKGAVKKRSQVKTKLGRQRLDQTQQIVGKIHGGQEAGREENVGEEVQGRAGGEAGEQTLKECLMPRYFFNVYHDRAELDEEGEELPDMQAAWREATVTAGQIIQDLDGKLRPGGKDWRLEVTDEFANPLYIIHVSADRAR